MVADLSDKTYVITGATSGIGYATVELLLRHGANVVGIGRNPDRCEKADATLKLVNAEGKIAWCSADLSLTSAVHSLAKDIQGKLVAWGLEGLDGLVNNAGTVPFRQTFTLEGLDTQWAVNHMAPFILSIKLMPLLHSGTTTRILTISSNSHYRGRMHWDDIQLSRHYGTLRAYEYTKLCNVLFTVELDRRLRGSGRRAFAADPGLVNTDIGTKSKSPIASLFWSIRRRGGIPAHG